MLKKLKKNSKNLSYNVWEAINKKPHERRSLSYSIFDNHNELECDACLIYTIKMKSNNLIKTRKNVPKKELIRITDMSVVSFKKI